MLKPTVTEPKPVAVTSLVRAVSSENDTTPEALVVDRKSRKRKAKSCALLEHSHGGARHLEGQRQLNVDCSKKTTIGKCPNNPAIRTMHKRIRQADEAQTYRQAHTRGWS